jgi:L-ascorbate metabolism protein UlaG (beta-lactamase superfamily)
MPMPLTVTYIGGPTALIELGGLRLLIDPTFDPAGSEYRTPTYVLRKTQGPAISPDEIGAPDVVLLSHDHHLDNLDRSGRQVLQRSASIVTTVIGGPRISEKAVGLAAWQSHDMPTSDGRVLRITATPARHGPSDGDRGPVIGFILGFADDPRPVVYISGDTVWYDGIVEVSRRFQPRVAMLFAGAARVPEVGPDHLTLTAAEAVEAARMFVDALIVPLHFEGWAHFSESRADIEQAFDEAGIADRLRWLPAGRAVDLGQLINASR